MILQTPRLTLREAILEDAGFFLALLNSPNWIAHIGDRGIRNLEAAELYVSKRLQPHYVTYGYGLWVVELSETTVPIGICGVLRRAGLDDPDVGFAFLPEYEGQGYAFEAAEATMRFARKTLALTTILAITTATNGRSIQLLERIGLSRRGTVVLPGEEEEMRLFGIAADMELPQAPSADAQAIEALVRRFYRSFNNQGGVAAPVDQIFDLFIPQGIIIQNTGPEPQIYELPAFVAPRKVLLGGDRLIDFEEHECSADTQIVNRIAHRLSHYEKSGVLDGVAFRTRGIKTMQFILTAKGWRFSAVAWEDMAS